MSAVPPIMPNGSQASRPGYAPVVLAPWARLAMLAEAVDQLARVPAGYQANRAARQAWPGWLVQRARVGAGGTAAQPWRRWEQSARALVTDATARGQRAELLGLLARATTAASSALAPAGVVLAGAPSAVVSAAVRRARALLEAARSGKTWRRITGVVKGKGAAAAAGAAGGAGAAAAGAGAVAAGSSAGRELARPGGVLDPAGWSTAAKVGIGAAVVGLAAWGIYRATAPRQAAPVAITGA